MSPLPLPDLHHLRAAQGWLELGNPKEAEAELGCIADPLQSHPDVLALRWHISADAKHWDACVEFAEEAIRSDPDRADAWIHRSFALHEMQRTEEAFTRLLPVVDRFPRVWTIPYNLACYCARLGRLEEARSWLNRAQALDEVAVKTAALEDPDLEPLRRTGS